MEEVLIKGHVGIGPKVTGEALVYPDDLPSEALLVIETAAEDILGVEHGKLGELSLP